MYGYNPSLPPRCTDEECGGTTKEIKRNGDEWVILRCVKCQKDFVILGKPVRSEKGDAWPKEEKEWEEAPKEIQEKFQDLKRELQ